MILVRDVFQAKYGKDGKLAQLFKDASEQWDSESQTKYARRLLTDLSGPFFTVVTETEVDSLAEFQKFLSESFSRPDFGERFARMEGLVESGQRELYTIGA